MYYIIQSIILILQTKYAKIGKFSKIGETAHNVKFKGCFYSL